MANILHVALQEGFDGDAVVLTLNGEEVCRRDAVTTRTQIGFADSLDLTVEDREAELEISLPNRALTGSTSIEVTAEPTYVGISIENGELALRTQCEPFGYV